MGFDQLWAPWRLPYITQASKTSPPLAAPSALLPGGAHDCFLCQAAVLEDTRATLVVRKGTHSLTVLNRFPYNNGHLLVAPLLHLARPGDLSEEIQRELMNEITRLVGKLEILMNAEGFNIGLNLGRVAGAGVPGHLHWHIVPRWNGDTNFMPTLSAVNVIPQSLEALWELLTTSE